MERVKLKGELAPGAEVEMKPIGQDPITSVVVEVIENVVYRDRTDLGDVILSFSHRLYPTEAGGTKVVHRLEITGPKADELGPQIGPAITQDFPEAMSALLARAAG